MSIRETIRATVRARLLDGTYSPGAQLPSLAELGVEFACSEATAVNAMRTLVEDGYVVASRGRGYFAVDPPPAHDGSASREDALREIVADLRREARRLQELADRLDREISEIR